ncbi:hypothetical protein WH47_08031 [Habropoda laboriosa]|uniref:Uncharacterized protein n=1 Tax=Habropoda laboriosa TaxID=597456 RepID=A0A0L7REU4_9HYME|nr:hypothetical protein WH47_08031 [Habropoda laboriosa]
MKRAKKQRLYRGVSSANRQRLITGGPGSFEVGPVTGTRAENTRATLKVPVHANHELQLHQHRRWDLNDADQQENLQWIEIRIKLQQFHYLNGQLNLRCSAQIPGIYSETSEVQLGAGLREPVPERGNMSFMLTLNEATLYNADVRKSQRF